MVLLPRPRAAQKMATYRSLRFLPWQPNSVGRRDLKNNLVVSPVPPASIHRQYFREGNVMKLPHRRQFLHLASGPAAEEHLCEGIMGVEERRDVSRRKFL